VNTDGEARGGGLSLDRVCGGLSGIGRDSDRVLGRDRRAGNGIDGDRGEATRCKPVCGSRRGRRDRSVGRNPGLERWLGEFSVVSVELDRGR
jgi:hypothetical protein